MTFKFIVFAAFVATASAGVLSPLGYAAPVAVAKTVVAEQYDPNPQYSYGYQVQDGLTGDNKAHSETRNGDVVQGSYSLVDADGTLRVVEYTADPLNGFNAVVHKQPLAAKAVVAAPAIAKIAAPLTYASPLAYSAPIAKVHAPLAYSSSIYH